ncbi:hypothetical protein EVAR_42661_1 [Eumeta japonica]|uniref:Uncharacterized protein n=1 Tax=Eumeta variegata TaxID=151549 RepID=A0A4C1YNX0_EUMVA|nr:hypothetical protein EVAR_42661_1 [Eumeta japonica]
MSNSSFVRLFYYNSKTTAQLEGSRPLDPHALVPPLSIIEKRQTDSEASTFSPSRWPSAGQATLANIARATSGMWALPCCQGPAASSLS